MKPTFAKCWRLFSAMRIEECTSLQITSFKSDDGVPIMHVKDAKTPSGIRYVPLHPTLIKMGFLDYMEEVKKLGKTDLFWYLSNGALGELTNHNGTRKNLSRRFSEYLKKVGVKADDNCFHSLRHTTITRWVARNINNSTIYTLSGHKSEENTHYNYLHSLPSKALKEATDALDFEDTLDLKDFDWKPSLAKLLTREQIRESKQQPRPKNKMPRIKV